MSLSSISVLDFQSASAPADFSASLKEIGFAVLKNHPVDLGLIDMAYAKWLDFFNQNDAEKMRYEFDANKHDGYISKKLSETAKGEKIKDIKEFYHFYSQGRCPEGLFEVTQALFDSMSAMAGGLLQWVEDNTPAQISQRFSMPLSSMIKDSSHTLLRLLHYPALTGNEEPGAVRAAAHEDINLITCLPSATTKGLQVKNKAGEWLPVPCQKDWMVINTGDMLQECTDGYYRATTHRVVNPEGEEARKARLALPLFLHPRPEVVLSSRHTADSYRNERFAELGLY